MAEERTARGEAPGAAEAAIRSRADELIAGMTTAEKAGQLTQYFYFGFYRGSDDVPAIGGIRPTPEEHP